MIKCFDLNWSENELRNVIFQVMWNFQLRLMLEMSVESNVEGACIN